MAKRADGQGSARPAARRKRGEGSYEHLADGNVRYRVMRGYRPDGKRDRLEFRGPTEAACWQQYLDHLGDERAHGQAAAQDKRRATVARFVDVFDAALEDEVRTATIAPRTAAFYRETARRYVLPALGRRRLRDLTAEDLERLYASHAGMPRTAQAVQQTVSRMLRMAKRYRYVSYNPATDAARPSYKAPERTPPGGAELRRLLDEAEKRGPQVAAWLVIAAAGLRPGEILGLTWPSVRLDDGYVDVEGARETRGRPEPKAIKSEKGRRSVPLTRRAVALLRAHAAWQQGRSSAGLVFCTRDGKPLSYRNVYRTWVPVRDAAGLPKRIRPYDLRHAFVTELLAEGVPLQEVSWLAGHASAYFTADTYAHRVKRRDPAARSALERALGET